MNKDGMLIDLTLRPETAVGAFGRGQSRADCRMKDRPIVEIGLTRELGACVINAELRPVPFRPKFPLQKTTNH